MVSKGLLVRLGAKSGQEEHVEGFLLSALPLVQQEDFTTAWFALRFGRSEYGIFDVFEDEAAREKHLSGPVAKALREETNRLFAPPQFHNFNVLAHKLPTTAPGQRDTKGLLLTMEAKEGHEERFAQFLRDAKPLVEKEPDTTAWFAFQTEIGNYGIFDVFPDNGARFRHLVGQVPRELAKNALSLLGRVPDMDMLDVLAEKLGGKVAAAKAR